MVTNAGDSGDFKVVRCPVEQTERECWEDLAVPG